MPRKKARRARSHPIRVAHSVNPHIDLTPKDQRRYAWEVSAKDVGARYVELTELGEKTDAVLIAADVRSAFGGMHQAFDATAVSFDDLHAFSRALAAVLRAAEQERNRRRRGRS